MSRLEGVSAADLRRALDDVDGRKATLRLVVGINYKHGVTQAELADWYGLSRTTVHHWLERLERLPDEPLEAVLEDADRPGRPPKLTDDQWAELVAALDDSPDEHGYDAAEWSPGLVREFIEGAFGVEYSRRHVRTLIDRAREEPPR